MTPPLSPLALERRAYRRRRTAAAVATSVGATVIVVALVVWLTVTSPGWDRARSTFFDPHAFAEVLPALAQGLWLNLRVWVIVGAISLVLGLALAVVRSSRSPALFPARAAVTAYVDVFRGVPLLLVLLLFGFGLPSLRLPWLPVDGVVLGTAAIAATYTAYTTEIFRSGLRAVPAAQVVAARSLGLSATRTLLRVTVPQAVRAVHPALLNTLVSLQKDSGLISVVGAVDAIRAAQIAVTGSYNYTPYVAAGVLFLLVSVPLTRAVDAYSRRVGA